MCNDRNHIYLNIECLENEQPASRLGYSNSSKQFTLAELPSELDFCQKKYKLVAAIVYIPGKSIGHYISYIRKITGRWEMHDGLSTDKKLCLITDRALLQKRRVHLLFYIQV